ncbi:MAG: ATP-binding protein [Bacteroidales bacterium]|nr:ATP-binding protein [Bacteroidales bacterium]
MNHASPRKIALFNALFITVAAVFILALVLFFFYELQLLPFFVFAPFIFISSYLAISYSLEKFIYEKIKIIYKTIGWMGSRQKPEKGKRKSRDDELEIVNQLVLEWSGKKEKEIEELKKMATYRREFLGNVSHELKTPIFNIQGYILTLLDGGLKDDKINTKFLERSVKSINRMIAIVEDLEDIARLESGELTLHQEAFDLNQLAREVIEFMEMKAAKYKAKIVFRSASQRPVNVFGDKRRIRQVFINLIDNAIKYGDSKQGEVNISFYDFHDNYLIEISDNGMGIHEENLYRIFERFYRTDEGRSRKKGGSGLGLAIVKHILEAHRQTISVRSQPGEGTTFSFTLKQG